MRVRCVEEPAEFHGNLTVGTEYVVYGATTHEAKFQFYVIDDLDLGYPEWRDAELFEVVDPALPPSWILNYHPSVNGEPELPIISYPEWALDEYYYERLVDEDPEAVAIFRHRRVEAEQTRSYPGT